MAMMITEIGFVLSLNSNIKGFVGSGNYETLKKKKLISKVISYPAAHG